MAIFSRNGRVMIAEWLLIYLVLNINIKILLLIITQYGRPVYIGIAMVYHH